jgi:hypothetical protein
MIDDVPQLRLVKVAHFLRQLLYRLISGGGASTRRTFTQTKHCRATLSVDHLGAAPAASAAAPAAKATTPIVKKLRKVAPAGRIYPSPLKVARERSNFFSSLLGGSLERDTERRCALLPGARDL